VSTATTDTNVLASSLLGRYKLTSTPGEILRRWRRGAFDLALSEHILGVELPQTLRKPFFQRQLTARQRILALQLFRRHAQVVPIIVEVHGVATHPEDDLVVATAVSAHADYLVTGDTQLQALGSYEGVQIVSPRAFLDILDAEISG
jgi:putative PIN family toxin of toxin-antitoxin system